MDGKMLTPFLDVHNGGAGQAHMCRHGFLSDLLLSPAVPDADSQAPVERIDSGHVTHSGWPAVECQVSPTVIQTLHLRDSLTGITNDANLVMKQAAVA